MKQKSYLFICIIMVLAGILAFAYHKEIIIINRPKLSGRYDLEPAQKTAVLLFNWHHNEWHTEQIPLLLSQDKNANYIQLIGQLLQLMHTEKIISKKVSVQSALTSFDTQRLLVSFDQMPWNKEWSTFEKWMIMESILKTIRAYDPAIKKVVFLVAHQPLNDTHLDFTNAWPIEGFL